MEGKRGEWRDVEEGGGGYRRVERSRGLGVEESRGEWRAAVDRGCRINLMDTCEVCDDQLPLSYGVYGPHPHPSVYVHVDM